MIKHPEFEFIHLTADDFSMEPSRMNAGSSRFCFHVTWVWGWIFYEDGQPPRHFLREISPDGHLHEAVGCVQLSNHPQKPQIAIGNRDHMNADPSVPAVYRRIDGDPDGLSDDPYVYEYSAIGTPEVLYRFSSGFTRIIEGDVLDLTFEHLPYAYYANHTSCFPGPYIYQPAIATGTYMGKPVKFLGGWDRAFAAYEKPSIAFVTNGQPNIFTGIIGTAIREDGRWEWCGTTMIGKRSAGFYWLEGEEPEMSVDVQMDPVWEQLSYGEPHERMLTGATFHVGERVIHYEAKWGYRGYRDTPRGALGSTSSSGIWYEGDTPRKYRMNFVFSESHNALEEIIKRDGRWRQPDTF